MLSEWLKFDKFECNWVNFISFEINVDPDQPVSPDLDLHYF